MRTAQIDSIRRQSHLTMESRSDSFSMQGSQVPRSLPAVGKRVWASPAPLSDDGERSVPLILEAANVEHSSVSVMNGNSRLSPLEQWMRDSNDEDEADDDDRTVTTLADIVTLTEGLFSSSASATGQSDTISSMSLSSSVSKRPSRQEYSNKRLRVDVMERDLLKPCSCTRQSKFLRKSCHSTFNIGEILNMRRERVLMDQSTERQLCIQELTQATKSPEERILVGCKLVAYRECCIGGYCLAYGLSRSSVYRMRTQLQAMAKVPNLGAGRPKKTREDMQDDAEVGPSSPDQQYIEAWLNEWLELEADKDPVGNDCEYVLDLVDSKDVYEEFIADYNANTIFAGSRVASERTFRRVWDWWIIKNRIRIRDKKNTTTKCQGNLWTLNVKVIRYVAYHM